jgi:hypothetical protein
MSIKPLSREYLLAKGSCCKNFCTNCPYGFKNKNKNMKEKEKKYYTPNIEDIHVGYEYQILETSDMTWINKIEDSYDFNTIWDIYNEGKQTNIRVPYLTKEQIESEGWEFVKSYESDWDTRRDVFKKKNYKVTYDYWESDGMIMSGAFQLMIEEVYSYTAIIYKGYCKSINEFKTICKLLKI